MAWSTPSITIDGGAIVIGRWFKRARIAFDRIRAISGEKVDKIMYEENFLQLHLDDGSSFALGELDKGFDAAEAVLKRQFQGFDAGWRRRLETSEAGVRIAVWQASDASKQ